MSTPTSRSLAALRERGYTAQVVEASVDGLHEVGKVLEARFGEPNATKILWKPQNTVSVDDEKGEKVLKMLEALEDLDDVQNVYANFEISEALMTKMSG